MHDGARSLGARRDGCEQTVSLSIAPLVKRLRADGAALEPLGDRRSGPVVSARAGSMEPGMARCRNQRGSRGDPRRRGRYATATPPFPPSPRALERTGALPLTVPGRDGRSPVSAAAEWSAVRRVSAADATVGRVLDGHLNAVERLTLPPRIRCAPRDARGGGGRLTRASGAPTPRPAKASPRD